MLQPRGRDGRVKQIQLAQLMQAAEVSQSGVGDLGAAKEEPLEVCQVLEVLEARVRYARAAELKCLKLRHRFNQRHACVGNFVTPERYLAQCRRCTEVFETFVRDFSHAKIEN